MRVCRYAVPLWRHLVEKSAARRTVIPWRVAVLRYSDPQCAEVIFSRSCAVFKLSAIATSKALT